MTCDDARAKLPLHLTADLPAAESAGVIAHLAGCPGCRADHAALAAVRALLDAVPVSPVPPPDVAAIYTDALDRHVRSARRWKRAAVAVAALAAGLLGFAVLPRLEARFGANEFAVRWGPADVPPPLPPAPSPVVVADPAVLAKVDRFDAELRSLKDLLLTVAADVDDRDRQQTATVAAMTRHLAAFEAAAREQFRQAEQTNSALYSAVFDKPKLEGGTP